MSERNFLEASLELGEAVVDAVTSNELVAAIPVIGTAIKICKGVDDFRSRITMAKLITLLNEPSLKSVDKLKLSSKLIADPERSEELGLMLLMVLDKVTDLKKPLLLAKVLVAYVDDRIDRVETLSLIHAIDVSFTLDLQCFITNQGVIANNQEHWVGRLAGTGFYSLYSVGAAGMRSVEYHLSPLGNSLLRVIQHCDSQSS